MREAYRDYLRAGATPAAALILAPIAGGELGARLMTYARGELPGAVSVGPSPVAGAPLGARWFDTVELTESVLVPSGNQTTWCSLRPIARWQFAGFLDVARIDRTDVATLDPARLAAGDERAPVRDLAFGEVVHYLYWVGKMFAGVYVHRSARALVGDTWSDVRREWVGSGATEGDGRLATPETLGTDEDDDAREEAGDDPIDATVTVGPRARVADATFRTAVPTAYGLFTSDVPSEPILGARVLRRFAR